MVASGLNKCHSALCVYDKNKNFTFQEYCLDSFFVLTGAMKLINDYRHNLL